MTAVPPPTLRAGVLDPRPTGWSAAEVPDLTGRRALVTGTTSGLGRALAGRLARAGADVVLVARDERRGAAVRDELVAAGTRGRLVVERADVADLDSVRDLADRLVTEGAPLDVLVHNAGVQLPRRQVTRQGHEVQLATHALGPHALTRPLLDLLDAGERPRVVTVGSGMYRLLRASLDLTDLGSERRYSAGLAYTRTKLAGMVLARELDRRLVAAGSSVRSVVAHPGVARTTMQRSAGTPLAAVVGAVLSATLGRDVEQGVLPILHAAVAPDVDPARLLGPAGPRDATAVVTERHVGDVADPAVGAALWDAVEALVGVSAR